MFSFYSLSTFSQNKTCVDFETGEFIYADAAYKDWKITRTEMEQIETNKATGLVVHNTIKWVSPCEFALTCTKVSQPKYMKAVGKVFKVVITETSEQGYTCILLRNDIQPKNMEFEMMKID